uniref:G-protein coupled receptors family 1 profile domain-containing protein n=1 Tax=Callorhinchus milii TaxID=7868 RepID=A0A4W3GVL1_CALMI
MFVKRLSESSPIHEPHGSAHEYVPEIMWSLISNYHSAGNLLAIVILSRGKCGLSICVTRYLVAMAMADLLVVVSDVILSQINYLYFPVGFLDLTPVCAFGSFLIATADDSSVWLTVAFTFDRFVIISCEKLKRQYCTQRTAALVIGIVWVLSCLSNIPWYFAYESILVIKNIPHIIVANRIRRHLLSQNQHVNNNDAETENRKKCIILLFTISGSFISLWMTYVVYVIYGQIAGYSYTDYNEPVYILYQSASMLQLLSCATNTCIYAVTQTKFRQEMRNMVAYICSKFTGDTNLGGTVNYVNVSWKLQRYLDRISEWSKLWYMEFNVG